MKTRTGTRQRGAAMIAIVALLLMGAAYVLLGSLNAASLRVDRDRVTREAMLKAKEALIGYAVSDPNRPGELPCPDVNDDGKVIFAPPEDMVLGLCASLVGRLPWSTLGLPDLRDGNGERLWYALSDDFRAGGGVALNSDTAYRGGNSSLTINGTQAAANVVAIVFSAGAPLQRADGVSQVRGCTPGVNCDAVTSKCTTSPASLTPKCNPLNFLDVLGASDNSDLDKNFVSGAESSSFNDRLLPVYSDDIMSLVQKRVGQEFAQRLRSHYDAWENAANVSGTDKGFYPWAATFNDPATAQVGANDMPNGLLPLSNAPLVWTSASGSCSGVGTTQIDCTATVVCILGICTPAITGQIDNIATRFADPPQPASVQVIGVSLGGTASWTSNKSLQRLDFSYDGFLIAGTIHIIVSAPPTSAWISSSWTTANNWHQNAYYALSPGYAVNINGTKSCVVGAGPLKCVTISNTAAPNNDKQAVIVMTGRALAMASPAQNPRPTVVVDDYLEGTNKVPAALVFEHNLRSESFNDQPILVRP